MELSKSTWPSLLWTIIAKETVCELRQRYALSGLVMFAVVTLTCVSMSLGGASLTPVLAAVMLWVIIFFSAMAGLARVFVQEEQTGTFYTLRVYANGQAVLFGKMVFNIVLLLVLTALVLPLFVVFMNIDIYSWGMLVIVLLLGESGIGAASTIIAAIVARTEGQGTLFAVLTFPILLPLFLSSINATAKILSGATPGTGQLVFLVGFDSVLIAVSSLLFEYLWCE